jgi:cytochrome b6-f complex iron-sulfur subunit
MNRREFFGWFSVSALASSLPLALAACSPETKESTSSDGFKSLGKVSELDQKGIISTSSVIVIRNPSDQSSLIAVNSKCTHQGCAVSWEKTEKSFVCPCHQSKFATDGKVVKGPAKEPLQTYATKIENGDVLVSLKAVS